MTIKPATDACAHPGRSSLDFLARGRGWPATRSASRLSAGLLVLLMLLTGSGLQAEPAFLHGDDRSVPTIPLTGPDCAGGLRLDDGGFEGGVGWTNSTLDGRYTMRFVPPGAGVIEAVCLCWTRSEFATLDALHFELLVLADAGADQPPGEVLARLPVQAAGVPRFDQGGGRFYRYPLPQQVDGPVHLAVAWSPNAFRQFFLCSDSGPDTPLQAAWSSADGGGNWTRIVDLRPSFRALGIRLDYGRFETPALPVPLAIGAPLGGLLALAGAWMLRRRLTARARFPGSVPRD